MRILTINHSEITEIGGINKTVRRLSEELQKRGHQCVVLQLNDGNLAKEERLQGVRVIRIKSRISRYAHDFNLSLLHYLAQHLGEIDPDIIHVHHYRSLLTPEVLLLLRSRGYPLVFSPYYERLGYNTLAGRYLFTLYRNATKQMLNWPDKVVANTDYTKQLLMEDLELKSEKIQVIPNGVEKIELHKKERIKRPMSAEINLLSAGYLDEKKGIQYMLHALRELRNKGHRARLTIIGKGGFKHTLQRVARECSIDDLISWEEPVPQDELYQKLADADIFFLLSREESYGIVVAEALAMGTPSIVSSTTALGEFTKEPGCFGIDYPANPRELSDLVLRIFADGVQVGPFSDKIRTWEQVVVDYEGLYQQVLEMQGRNALASQA
jgi:glycogen(starch) synthase